MEIVGKKKVILKLLKNLKNKPKNMKNLIKNSQTMLSQEERRKKN